MLPQDSLLLALTDKLPDYHLGGTRLRIVQGDDPGATFNATEVTSTMLRDMYQVTQERINRQAATIDSLRAVGAEMARNDTMGATLAPELRVLFPDVQDIAVTRAIAGATATGRLDTLDIALVRFERPMPVATERKFRDYLRARLSKPGLTIVSVK